MYSQQQIINKINSSLECMKDTDTTLSQEGILDTLKGFVPNMLTDAINFFKNMRTNPNDLALNIDEKKLHSAIKNINFMDLRNINADCPEGLNTYYVNYLEDLKEAVRLSVQISAVIGNFNWFIGPLISDRKKFTDATTIHEYMVSINEYTPDIKEINKKIKRNFKPNSKQEGKLGDFIRNKNELDIAINLTDKYIKELNKVDRDDLTKETKITADYCAELKNMINNGEIKYVSPDLPKVIGEMILTVATMLSLYSTTVYAVMSLSKAIEDTCDNLVSIYG